MSDQEPGWAKGRRYADTTGVEVQRSSEGVLVRNSRDPEEVLRFTPDEWRLFLGGVKRGEFD
jgi:hypothetical protein